MTRMRRPSVLRMSGSSIPSSCTFVPEKSTPCSMDRAMPAAGAFMALSVVATPISAISSITGPPNQPPPRPYGPTRSTASALRWVSSWSHAVNGTRPAVSWVPDTSTTPVVVGPVVDTTVGSPERPSSTASVAHPVASVARATSTAPASLQRRIGVIAVDVTAISLTPWSASMLAGWSRIPRSGPRAAARSRCRPVPAGTAHGWRGPSGRSTRSRRREPPASGWPRPR